VLTFETSTHLDSGVYSGTERAGSVTSSDDDRDSLQFKVDPGLWWGGHPSRYQSFMFNRGKSFTV
jgi:hypothetical protein